MTVRFDDAFAATIELAKQAAASTHLNVILVRDVVGRVSLIIDDTAGSQPPGSLLAELATRLADTAGPFTGPTAVTLASQLFAPDPILHARDLLTIQDSSDVGGRVSMLERSVVGAEWLHPRAQQADARVRRVTLYGFKGGVGRSTATFMLAKHIAAQGRCVLVTDLDLESPGVGALLQGDDDLPDHGLVDYLVESAVGNEGGLELVVRSRLAPVQGNGEVWVAPAGGRPREGYDYLAKLNRAYIDLPGGTGPGEASGLASRLEAAIRYGEESVAQRSRRPDVVLIDSRAGIHDIAAIAITQLADMSLLFAADSAPTWHGYGQLFRQWRQMPEQARLIRTRLQMVASMVPRERRDAYLEQFSDHSQSCFAASLYDDVPGGGDFDADEDLYYNPAPDDESAPHFPLPILFIPELIGMDLADRPGWHEIDYSAYTAFLEAATDLILGEG